MGGGSGENQFIRDAGKGVAYYLLFPKEHTRRNVSIYIKDKTLININAKVTRKMTKLAYAQNMD
jgi:hypothetical protein